MKALVRVTQSSYEVGDIVTVVDDSHVFGGGDIIAGHREEINIGPMTDSEKDLLLICDSRFKNTSAIRNIPAFRHSLFNCENLSHVKRRKYKLDASNKPELKDVN